MVHYNKDGETKEINKWSCQILCSLLQENVTALETTFELQQTYRSALQECEKWILQMSFRLMSHNTISMSTSTLTDQQMLEHEVQLYNCLAKNSVTKWCKRQENINYIKTSL